MGEVVQNAVECVLLVELDVGVAVTVLHADDDLLAALYIGQHRHPRLGFSFIGRFIRESVAQYKRFYNFAGLNYSMN